MVGGVHHFGPIGSIIPVVVFLMFQPSTVVFFGAQPISSPSKVSFVVEFVRNSSDSLVMSLSGSLDLLSSLVSGLLGFVVFAGSLFGGVFLVSHGKSFVDSSNVPVFLTFGFIDLPKMVVTGISGSV